MTRPGELLIEIDGAAATAEDMWPALGGYGHFTAMQVRGGRVRGLDFHLARLDGATRELFGTGLDGERVRGHIRHALGGWGGPDGDASVRVNVFRPVDAPGSPVAVLVAVRPPATVAPGPKRVKSVPYQRPVAHLKHTGGFGQGYYIRQVEAEGYDEALLVGPGGEIAEGAVTNLGLIDGGTVVWPDAPYLHGIAMQVLERELGRAGVPMTRRPVLVTDLGGYGGAFLANSRGLSPVAAVDGTELPLDAELLGRVMELYEAAPWDVI